MKVPDPRCSHRVVLFAVDLVGRFCHHQTPQIQARTRSFSMIISHKHQFIFIHLGRTGGRSMTMELVKHCGPDDVITPTGDYLGQNHAGWHRHASAISVRERFGSAMWDKYFTFTFERNPWEKVLSNYWAYKGYRHGYGGSSEQIFWTERLWRKISGYPWSLDGWLKYRIFRSNLPGASGLRLPQALTKYTDEAEQVMVDTIYRYEQREEHLKLLSERLGLDIKLEAREGRGTRHNRARCAESYSHWSRDLVAEHFQKDLLLLKYEFDQPAPVAPILSDREGLADGLRDDPVEPAREKMAA